VANRFSIEAVFKAVDRMSGNMRKIAGNSKAFSKRLRRDFAMAQRRVEKFSSSVRQNLGNALKRAAVIGMAGLMLSIGYVTREFISFDHAIVSATAKFKDLVPGSKEAQAAMQELRKTARRVGADTQFSATEAAKGLEFLGMAGFSSSQAMALLPDVVDLATVANVDLARATDIASDALGAFGLATEDTTQLQKNLMRVNDVMAATITATNTDMEMLFETMKFAGPAFTSAGQSIETFNAIAGRMAANGIKASMAGTSMRSAMLRLQRPTKEVRKGLALFGLTQADLVKDGKLMDMIDIFALLEKRGKGLTQVQKNSALTAIVGKNAFSGWAAILNEGVGRTKELREALDKATGSAARMAAEMRKSLQNRLAALKSAAIELGFKFIEAFEQQGGGAIDDLTKAIREFDPKPLITGLKLAVKFLALLISVGSKVLPFIIGLVVAWKAYHAILFIVAAKQVILNALMMANPIGLIITGIGLLIGAIILLYNNWGTVVDALMTGARKVADFFKMTFFTIADVILATIGNVVKGIITAAAAASEFVGEDAAELREIIKDLEKMQKSVRGKSVFGVEGLKEGQTALDIVGKKHAEETGSPLDIVGKKHAEETGSPLTVETQRETLQRSISESKSSQEVIIRNDSKNDVDSGGRRIGTSGSIILEPSG